MKYVFQLLGVSLLGLIALLIVFCGGIMTYNYLSSNGQELSFWITVGFLAILLIAYLSFRVIKGIPRDPVKIRSWELYDGCICVEYDVYYSTVVSGDIELKIYKDKAICEGDITAIHRAASGIDFPNVVNGLYSHLKSKNEYKKILKKHLYVSSIDYFEGRMEISIDDKVGDIFWGCSVVLDDKGKISVIEYFH